MNELLLTTRMKFNGRVITFLQTIGVFALLFCCSGFIKNVISEAILISICLVLGIVILLSNKKTIQPNKLIWALIFAFLTLISFLINPWNTNSFFYALFAIIVSFLYSSGFSDFKSYGTIFTSVLFFLSSFSLVVYVISWVSPQFIYGFPKMDNGTGFQVYNLFFSVVSLNRSNGVALRNYGIFWEPGAYQSFLNLAILIELLIKKKPNRFKIFILGLAVITTFSTTGYICLFAIFMFWLLRNKHFKTSKKIIILMVFLFLLTIGFVVINAVMPGYLEFVLFTKFKEIGTNPNIMTSGEERLVGLKLSVSSFLNNPIFGVGKDFGALTTFTPLNYFAFYGLIYGISAIYFLYSFASTLTIKKIDTFLVFILILLLICSEQYVDNPCITILLFFGIKEKRVFSSHKSVIRINKGVSF